MNKISPSPSDNLPEKDSATGENHTVVREKTTPISHTGGELLLNLTQEQKLSIEKSVPQRRTIRFPNPFKQKLKVPENLLRKTKPLLPEMSELDIIRHFTRLSKLNFSVDTNFYPLGSCTMKYSPKINEAISDFEEFSNLHPLSSPDISQGTLEFLFELENMLCKLCGMDAFTLQPAAGAHSEFTGLLIAKTYFKKINQSNRTEIIIPDSAHGTNPATSSMLGFTTVNIKSGLDGRIDLAVLKKTISEKTAVVMLTIPNTLGIFETNIEEISKIVHEKGALIYMDGANFNALIGLVRPGDFGIDIIHLNMHKTFSTPHGGGGPGAGAIGVKKFLEDFLPVPRIIKQGDKYLLNYDYPDSIGKVKSFFGNVGVLIKAYVYLLMHTSEELKEIAKNSIINANYIRSSLKAMYPSYSAEFCMHECVLQPHEDLLKNGIKTIDIAKRLLDFGFHAPTIYFPLIVHEAIMIEPTETESKETLDAFIDAMKKIYHEGRQKPEFLKQAPYTMPVKRLDEVEAARKPNIRWEKDRI